MISPRSPRLSRRTLLRGAAALPLAAIAGSTPVLAQGTPPGEGTTPDPIPPLVAGNTAFALALLAQLRQLVEGNLLYSPYSVSQALAMTYAGAAGETATQMAEALDFDLPSDALNDGFALLNADLIARGSGGDGDGALRVANALWGEQTYPFSETYQAELASAYGAGLQETDFIGAPDAAREEINAWVAEQTEDRIQDIVPPGAISTLTRLVLANAIYFYGPWQSTFEPAATSDDVFHLLDGGTVSVPFMVQQESFPHATGDGWQAIELPYEQQGFAMTIVLPDEGTFEAFEEGLDPTTLDNVIAQLAWTEVILHLPKFEFEVGQSLVDPLVALGMTDAFDPALADFSGMVEGVTDEPISIGDVLHKAFISVDEEGTEAAAATVVIGVAGAAPPEQEPPEVRIDRPFLFAIRDTVTGTLLFLGRVLDPSV